MSLSGPHQTFVVGIDPPGSATAGPSGMGILNSLTGTAKRLTASGDTAPLCSIQVVVKQFIDDATPPAAPTDSEWSAGQLPPERVTYNSVTKTHYWTAGPFLVRVAGNGKNTISSRANWLISSFPPQPPVAETTVIEYVATISTVAAGRGSLAAAATVVPLTADFQDVLPSCIEGGWLLYKDIPANLIGSGARLMLNEYTPLRVAELGIAAANVSWELNASGSRLLGIRRPCGSNFYPSIAGLFPFDSLPSMGIVVHQTETIDPFVVLSSSRCQADIAVVNPGQDILVRLNVPDAFNLLVKGTYSLWINPHVGFPTSCGSSCETV